MHHVVVHLNEGNCIYTVWWCHFSIAPAPVTASLAGCDVTSSHVFSILYVYDP